MKKFIVLLVAVGLLGLLGWKIHQKVQEKRASEAQSGQRGGRAGAVPVEVAAIRKGTMRDIRTFTGSLIPASRFVVAPKVAGRLDRAAIDHMIDPRNYLGSAGAFVDRFLVAARTV